MMDLNTTFRRLSSDDIRRWAPVHYYTNAPYWKIMLAVISIILAIQLVVTR